MVNGGMSGVWDFCDIGLIIRRFEPFAYMPLMSVWSTLEGNPSGNKEYLRQWRITCSRWSTSSPKSLK